MLYSWLYTLIRIDLSRYELSICYSYDSSGFSDTLSCLTRGSSIRLLLLRILQFLVLGSFPSHHPVAAIRSRLVVDRDHIRRLLQDHDVEDQVPSQGEEVRVNW